MRSSSSSLIAEVYDLDKPIGGGYADVAYYKRLLAGETGRVLELACGTGRFLIPLLDAGLALEGLDHSPEMLAVCRGHCRDRGLAPVLHEADMAAFDLARAYEVVIIPAGAIKELDGREAALGTLMSCHRALTPGGLLVVDLIPLRYESELSPVRCWVQGSTTWTLQTLRLDYDSAANRTTEYLRYERWIDGSLHTAELHRFCIQYWTLAEFKDLLAEAGFSDISVIADYQDGRPPGPHDRDWTFHAIRR